MDSTLPIKPTTKVVPGFAGEILRVLPEYVATVAAISAEDGGYFCLAYKNSQPLLIIPAGIDLEDNEGPNDVENVQSAISALFDDELCHLEYECCAVARVGDYVFGFSGFKQEECLALCLFIASECIREDLLKIDGVSRLDIEPYLEEIKNADDREHAKMIFKKLSEKHCRIA